MLQLVHFYKYVSKCIFSFFKYVRCEFAIDEACLMVGLTWNVSILPQKWHWIGGVCKGFWSTWNLTIDPFGGFRGKIPGKFKEQTDDCSILHTEQPRAAKLSRTTIFMSKLQRKYVSDTRIACTAALCFTLAP